MNLSKDFGNNRFFWGLVEDCIWYKLEDVLSLIPEPKNVTNRHKQIDPDIWKPLDFVEVHLLLCHFDALFLFQ
jgi:hypothetical protein